MHTAGSAQFALPINPATSRKGFELSAIKGCSLHQETMKVHLTVPRGKRHGFAAKNF
jgi:hypothetical protein